MNPPPRRTLLAAAGACGLLTACSPLRVLNAVNGQGARERIEALAYGPGPRQQLDLYIPEGPPPTGGWPSTLFFYGGSWNTGERADYRFVGEALAARGVLVAVADYRLYPATTYPGFLQDGALALGWLLNDGARFGANPQRVHVMGHSAGAYNAAMLALDARWLGALGLSPQRLAGWVGLAGPYDFLPIGNPDVKPVFHHPDYPLDSQVFPHVQRGAPRSFLGAARSDALVDPQRNTVGLAERLKAQGVPVELHLYERVNHPLMIGVFGRPLRWLAPVLDDVGAFLTA
jgi:acetyl esterase/lipase